MNNSCAKKKEAGSVLNQMVSILEVMKDDLKYRRCAGYYDGLNFKKSCQYRITLPQQDCFEKN